MKIKTSRWFTLAASCIVTLCIGSVYAWSAFAAPMSVYLSSFTGGETPNLAIIFTVVSAVGPITMISGGYINDRLGPKLVLLAGGLLFGGGMFAASYVRSVAALVLTFGLGCGLGLGLIYGVTVSNTVKLFPDRSGFAGGIITAACGAGSIIASPLVSALVKVYPVTSVFRWLGVGMLVILCTSALVIESAPRSAQPAKTGASASSAAGEYTYREMLREPDAYRMLLTLTCGAFAGTMVISQAFQIAQGMMGLTTATASAAVSVIALCNTAGRLLSGTLSDRLGSGRTLQITFVLSLLSCILLFICREGQSVLFFFCLSIVGLAFGGIMGVYPGFTAQRFGRRHNSVNYGIMFIGFALSGLAAPTAMNLIVERSGRFQPAFLVSAVLSLAGILLILPLCRSKTRARASR